MNLTYGQYLHSYADFTLGEIDEIISTRQSSYVNASGLYLLPIPVPIKGTVEEICAYGYTRVNLIEGYLYLALYRPMDETRSVYSMAYNPTVLYHTTQVGCLEREDDDGLQWEVEPGDLFGAFIPDQCVKPADLLSQDSNIDILNTDELSTLDMILCPSLNLVDEDKECITSALYLEGSHLLSLDDITSIQYEDLVNVSATLNMRAEINGIVNAI